jgi:D-serine deaminase-like pyridoxal phosphate-dependent protein
MNRLKKTLNHFVAHSVKVPHCLVAGTPSFMPDVEFWNQNDADTEFFYSPGTWIYFDSATQEMMPNTFDYAAVILAQVIDKPTSTTATLNLGHKRWAVDQGPVDTLSVPGKVISWSEEHTVLQQDENDKLQIGDYVLIVPRHVCSTVNLWEHVVIIDKNGDIEQMNSPIDGRNR